MKRALCFVSGLMLALSVLASAVLIPALSTQLFRDALEATVDAPALGMTSEALSAFADATMTYLRGEADAWRISLPFSVPDAFITHMAEVRAAALAVPWVIALLLAGGILLLFLGKRDRRPCLAGFAAVPCLVLLLVLWAVIDFDSLWMTLHVVFIPGGIFSAHEPIMQLFPLGLFFRYLLPVCLLACALAAVGIGLILLITRKGR